jgi:hypothetical protein
MAGALICACHSPRPDVAAPPLSTPRLLLPASSLLTHPPLRDTAEQFVVSIKRATGDTVEKRLAEVRREQRTPPGASDRLLLASTWAPPLTSIDSVWVERRGFAPVHEHLVYRGTFDYRYAGARVQGTIQRTDSAPRNFDTTYAHPVFAFSEVDLLVRALPFRPGLQVIAPLFSESDADLEIDTMTVVGPDSTHRREPAWTVRFADPAIVSRYVIGEHSRTILATETLQRRTHSRLRYVPS